LAFFKGMQASTADCGTVLFVTESGFDAIPEGRRIEAFRMNDQGWTQQMTNIQRHVERPA
jgi:hypothetical protein